MGNIVIRGSNSVNILSEHLSNLEKEIEKKVIEREEITLFSDKSSDLLKKTFIITQNKVIERFVLSKISEKIGVYTGFRSFSVNEFFIDFVLKGLDSRFSILNKYYAKNYIKWDIFDIITNRENLEEIEEFEFLRKNLIVDEKVDSSKGLEFSRRISDLFDQYFFFRLEMIEKWNRGEDFKDNVDENFLYHQKWQKKLYLLLKERIKNRIVENEDVKLDFYDKVEFINYLFKNKDSYIKKGKALFKNVDKVVIFGLILLSPYHVKILNFLIKYLDLDIYYYIMQPTQHYWTDLYKKEDIEFEFEVKERKFVNFLISYGRLLSDQIYLLEKELSEDFFYNNDFIEPIKFRDNSILDKIKKIFWDLRFDEKEKSDNNTIVNKKLDYEKERKYKENSLKNDKSIKIVKAASKKREIEILYDFILKLLEDRDDISPSDILVVAKDITPYIPYIDFVFGGERKKASGETFKLQYNIIGNLGSFEDNPLEVFIMLLDLFDSEFHAERILNLIQKKYIKNKFGFENISIIRDYLKQAKVVWGLNEDNIKEYGSEENFYHSLIMGIKKLLFSFNIKKYQIHNIDNFIIEENKFYYLQEVDREEVVEELIKFYNFISLLDKYYRKIKNKSYSVKKWGEIFYNMFNDFISIEDDISYFSVLEGILSRYDRDDVEIDFSSIKGDFKVQTKETGGVYNNKIEFISFASAVDVRGISKKVVCFLGLNSSDFPSISTSLYYDLMSIKRKRGDRDLSIREKYLFLDSIFAAEDILYLSYQGRDPQKDEEIYPSQALADFIELIAELIGLSYEDTFKCKVEEYPLNLYSERYYAKSSSNTSENNKEEFFTYIDDYFIYEKEEKKEDKEEKGETIKEVLLKNWDEYKKGVSLNRFVKFFDNTKEFFERNILEIKDISNQIKYKYIENNEPLVYSYKTEEVILDLLAYYYKDDIKEKIKNFLKYSRMNIPLGRLGDLYFKRIEKEVGDFIKKIEAIIVGFENIKELDTVDFTYKNILVDNNTNVYLLDKGVTKPTFLIISSIKISSDTLQKFLYLIIYSFYYHNLKKVFRDSLKKDFDMIFIHSNMLKQKKNNSDFKSNVLSFKKISNEIFVNGYLDEILELSINMYEKIGDFIINNNLILEENIKNFFPALFKKPVGGFKIENFIRDIGIIYPQAEEIYNEGLKDKKKIKDIVEEIKDAFMREFLGYYTWTEFFDVLNKKG